MLVNNCDPKAVQLILAMTSNEDTNLVWSVPEAVRVQLDVPAERMQHGEGAMTHEQMML